MDSEYVFMFCWMVIVGVIILIALASTTSTIEVLEVENWTTDDVPEYHLHGESILDDITPLIIASENASHIALIQSDYTCLFQAIRTDNLNAVMPSLDTILDQPEYRVPFDHGYPIRYKSICIFNYDLISSVRRYPVSDEQIIIPSFVPSSTNEVSSIPHIVHQIFETPVIPKTLAQCRHHWINLNPDYEHRYWSTHIGRKFIQDNFEPEVLQAYDDLYPGAFKADVLRCFILYIYGGIYADIKLFPLVPLHRMVRSTDDLVLTLDFRTYGFLERLWYNAFFGIVPKHPLMLEIIQRIVQNVQHRKVYTGGFTILDITGPGVWRDVIKEQTGRTWREGHHILNIQGRSYETTILGHSFNIGHPHTIVDPQINHLILAQPPNGLPTSYWEATGKDRYDVAPTYHQKDESEDESFKHEKDLTSQAD